MTELEKAIAAVKSEYAVAPYDGKEKDVIRNLEARILNAVATGQLVPAQTWQPIETAPLGTTKTVEGPKGPREIHVKDVVFCASDCGKVTQSYWIPKEGRWCMFTKDRPPIGWHPLPKHPSAPEQAGV